MKNQPLPLTLKRSSTACSTAGDFSDVRIARRSLLALTLLSASVPVVLLTSGCIPLVVGGAIASGSMIALDRRTSGAQLEDEGIELRASNRLRSAIGERAHINVTSYNRQVLVTGEVPSASDKQLAEQTVRQTENVVSVVNELAVLGNSTLAQRTSDVLVTGRVRAMLIDARDLQSSAFKVVTERGTTFLMGRVTQREADRATQIAQGVSGVQKVVRIFELLTEQQLMQMQPNRAPASTAQAVPVAVP